MYKETSNQEVEPFSKKAQISSVEPDFKIRKIEKVTTIKLTGHDPDLIGDVLLALTTDFSVRTTSELRFSKSSDEWFVFALIDRRGPSS
jgi:hypothetical protein